MKAIRQLLRQPTKFLSGVIAISLAVCVLCVCLGQSLVARKTENALGDQFTTIALQTTKYNFSMEPCVDEDGNEGSIVHWSASLPEDIENWIADTAQSRPNLVATVASPGLASAYIPS